MDEVIEISAVKVVGRKVTEEFTSLVKPKKERFRMRQVW